MLGFIIGSIFVLGFIIGSIFVLGFITGSIFVLGFITGSIFVLGFIIGSIFEEGFFNSSSSCLFFNFSRRLCKRNSLPNFSLFILLFSMVKAAFGFTTILLRCVFVQFLYVGFIPPLSIP